MMIGGQNVIFPGERGDQHDQRGLRQMKIRQESVHHLKPVAGIDENIRPAALRPDAAVLRGSRFKGSAARRPDADHPASVRPGPVDDVGRFLFDPVILRMHMVFGDFFDLDRPKCAESHMQRHMGDFHPHVLHLIEHLRRKMQSGRRRRGGSLMLRVNCLVPVFILKLMPDVRRQRHLAEPVEDFLENSLIRKLNQAVSVIHDLEHFSLQDAVAENKFIAGAAFLSRTDERFPDIVRIALQKQHFDGRPRIRPRPEQPRRYDLRVIDNQAVPIREVIGQMAEAGVRHFPRVPVDDHHAGGAPVRKRILRDQFFRKIIIKITRLHSAFFSAA